ncbi:MAG: hypothetical protein K2K52_08205 [Paramuribaculum sp.]|nr:hypothetical protein [Paramuribaculum sp.]
MADKKGEDIYEILGIDSTKTSEGSYDTAVDNTPKGEYLDLNAPTGSIFDDYSKYPKDPDNYWWYFRLWTFMGIGVVALLFIAGIVGAFMSSRSHNYSYDIEEVICTDTPDDDYAVEEVAVVEEVATDANTLSGSWYFSGTINDKYAIHMYLDFDTKSGKYYYVRSGSDNCMTLEITDIMEMDDQYIITMTEYNPSGERCGMWSGTLIDGSLTGYGEFLGKTMPFELQQCNSYETDF